jgi:hypothetical protein
MTVCVAFRGVDPSVIFDADTLPSLEETGNGDTITPPTITTTTNNAWVLIVGELGGSPRTIDSWPTGYTEIVQRTLSDTYDGVIGVAYKNIVTAGLETPGAIDFNSNGTERRAATLALRPKINSVFGNQKNSGIWSLASVLESK